METSPNPEMLVIDPNRDITEVALEYMNSDPDKGYKYLKELATKKGVIVTEFDGENSKRPSNHAFFEKNQETGKPEVKIFLEGLDPKKKLWEIFHELNSLEGVSSAIQESRELADDRNKKKKFWEKSVSADSFAEDLLIDRMPAMFEADIKVLESVGEDWTKLGIIQRTNMRERSMREVKDPEIVLDNKAEAKRLLAKLK